MPGRPSRYTDILFLQEHWLSEPQLHIFGSIDPDYHYTAVSGFGNDSVLSGRPYGECAIMWRSSLQATVCPVSVNSRRICAIRVSTLEWNVLFICGYLPCQGNELKTDEFAFELSVVDLINA